MDRTKDIEIRPALDEWKEPAGELGEKVTATDQHKSMKS